MLYAGGLLFVSFTYSLVIVSNKRTPNECYFNVFSFVIRFNHCHYRLQRNHLCVFCAIICKIICYIYIYHDSSPFYKSQASFDSCSKCVLLITFGSIQIHRFSLGVALQKRSETKKVSNRKLEGGRGFILPFCPLPNRGNSSFLCGVCSFFFELNCGV